MCIPNHFGDPDAEYDRLIHGLAMWDVAAQRQVEPTGPDAGRLAQYLTPRALAGLRIGQGRGDAALAALMENLGGNCVQTMADLCDDRDHDRVTWVVGCTITGRGTPIAGHKDNHGGLMNKTQMAAWHAHMGTPEGQEWEPVATVGDVPALQAFLSNVAFFDTGLQ